MITLILILLCLFIGALFGRALLSMVKWAIALGILAAGIKGLFVLLPELNAAEFFQGAGAVVIIFFVGAAAFFFSLGWAARADKTAADAIKGAEDKRAKDRVWSLFG